MDETQEIIAVLLGQEQRHYVCADYLPKEKQESPTNVDLVHLLEECANVVTDYKATVPRSPSAVSLRGIQDVRENEHTMPSVDSFGFWRQQMFDWACMVVDSFGMDREIVAISFNILDRFVAKETSKPATPAITRDDFQLFSMTSLYLAVKIMEPYPRKLGVEAMVNMSRGFYSQEDIVATEKDILASLNWHVHPTTAVGFCRLVWTLLPFVPSVDLQLACATMTEIAVADPFFISFRPSHIGIAALMHACRLEGREGEMGPFWSLMNGLMDTNHKDFQTVYRQLERLYCQ